MKSIWLKGLKGQDKEKRKAEEKKRLALEAEKKPK